MPATAPAGLMTTQDLLALPDDGVDRWLIRGQLRENPYALKDRFHAMTLPRVLSLLAKWSDEHPALGGEVLCGQVGCRLRRDPDSTVGVDVAYVPKSVPTDGAGLIDGAPTLAVEILALEDTIGVLREKVDEYLTTGVKVIWVVNTHDRTVTVHRPQAKPVLVNDEQELTGDPDLPGFRVAVARLFP